MSNEDTAEVIAYLEQSRSVWSRARGQLRGFLNAGTNRVDSTFFYATRANSALRLYGWGELGQLNFVLSATNSLNEDVSDPSTASGIYSHQSPPAMASPDAYDEAFPASAVSLDPSLYRRSFDTPHAPTTEEFFGRYAVHNPLQDVVSIAACAALATDTGELVNYILACTSEGSLYAVGRATNVFFSNPVRNEMGLGPLNFEPNTVVSTPTSHRVAADVSARTQTALQRNYGDDATFASVKFVKVQAQLDVSMALDSDGYIWFAGNATRFSEATDFSDNRANLVHFRKRTVGEWYDSSAQLVTGDELLFKDFWTTIGNIVALSVDDRLFICGNNFHLGATRSSTVFHEISGFVDTVSVTNQGDYSTTNQAAPNVAVEFSAPTEAYGVRATGVALYDNITANSFTISGIRIDNPGWGYTSPPQISFTPGADNSAVVAAEAECTVFDGTWKYASAAAVSAGSVNNSSSQFAAVSGDGIVYSWGASAVGNANTGVAFTASPRRVVGIVNAQNPQGDKQPPSLTYDKVFTGCSIAGSGTDQCIFGVAIDSLSRVSFWGNVFDSTASTSGIDDDTMACITPNLKRTNNGLVALASVEPSLEEVSFIDAACCNRTVALLASDGTVYTYGFFNDTLFLQGNGAAPLGQGKDTYNADSSRSGVLFRKIRPIIGSAKWVRIFAVTGNPVESFSRNGHGFYAVREPEELDPMYGTRINPLPPYQAPAP